MLTKGKIQYIKTLSDRKTRYEEGYFIVEGKKSILEAIDARMEIREIFAVDPSWVKDVPVTVITEKELLGISTLSTNHDGLAIVKMRTNWAPHASQWQKKITLVLDRIADPGNLGTIIRTADWYGITHIIASRDTVDAYNPKTIMATMGSFTRVSVEYLDLEDFLSQVSWNIYGAYLDGENLHEKNFSRNENITLVIGSESHGISPKLEKYITNKITIPRYGQAESLNASIATAIILDRLVNP